jgi:altronate hydrolase
MKLATNSKIYEHMKEDMDLNCGKVVDGELTLEQSGQEIFEEILAVASGKKTKSELLGYGDNEFIPWKIGAVV